MLSFSKNTARSGGSQSLAINKALMLLSARDLGPISFDLNLLRSHFVLKQTSRGGNGHSRESSGPTSTMAHFQKLKCRHST